MDERLRTRTGSEIPRLGLGTWKMGERPERRRDEVHALGLGLDLGLALIDTAEMYAAGGAERVVAEAIRGRRDRVYLVSKVLPSNASRRGTVSACEQSLARLGTDWLDLYLLHWPGDHPLADTLAGFEELKQAGKIRDHGLSNFDAEGMTEALGLSGGDGIACDQVLYNLARRGPEWSLGPLCRKERIALMAYTPLESGRLASHPAVQAVARRHETAAATVAIAWTLVRPEVVSIPKASRPEHVREIVAARTLRLSDRDLAELDRAFPPPRRETPLETA